MSEDTRFHRDRQEEVVWPTAWLALVRRRTSQTYAAAARVVLTTVTMPRGTIDIDPAMPTRGAARAPAANRVTPRMDEAVAVRGSRILDVPRE